MSHLACTGIKGRLIPSSNELLPWITAWALTSCVAARNVQYLDLVQLGLLFALSLVLATGLYGGFLLLNRCTSQAALMTSVTLVIFALYAYLHRMITSTGLPDGVAHAVLMVTWLSTLAFLGRAETSLRRLGTWAAITMLLVAVQSLLPVGKCAWLALSRRSRVQDCPVGHAASNVQPKEQADIYYIVLDGYGRADVLQRFYGFDNRPFLAALRQRGFFVAERSCANYPVTVLSLPSSLNMCYHADVVAPFDHRGYFEMVRAPLVAKMLQQHGYQYVHYNNNWPGACMSRIADQSLGVDRGMRDILIRFLEPSILHFLFPHASRLEHLSVLRQGFDAVPKVARDDRPTFTFAHFIAPHPPFVLDSQARGRVDIPQLSRESYINEIQGLNREILHMVDELLRASTTPPIIVIQSDHGPGFLADESGDDQEWVQERLPILNCYLVPPGVRENLYADITPINTFPLILSEVCSIKLPLRPDRHFLTHYRNLAHVAEVTDHVVDGRPDASLTVPSLAGRMANAR